MPLWLPPCGGIPAAGPAFSRKWGLKLRYPPRLKICFTKTERYCKWVLKKWRHWSYLFLCSTSKRIQNYINGKGYRYGDFEQWRSLLPVTDRRRRSRRGRRGRRSYRRVGRRGRRNYAIAPPNPDSQHKLPSFTPNYPIHVKMDGRKAYNIFKWCSAVMTAAG